MNPMSIPQSFTPISRSGNRIKPLAFFVAVAISGGAMAADSKPLELDATQIEDSALLPADDAGQLGYTVESTRSSTGLALTPRQTPQSVTTITRQQMDDRDIHTIEQALETTPGVTANKSEVGGRTDYRARGYSISNWKVDGLQTQGGSDFSGSGNALNMDLYERIDIVRGANGLLGGTGDPSATVNLIRKAPPKLSAAAPTPPTAVGTNAAWAPT